MNSKSTYTLIFLLSFMATMESQSYALSQSPNPFDCLEIQVNQEKEKTKKPLQSIKAIIVKKVHAQAALLKSEIEFLSFIQYQDALIAQGYNIRSTGISINANKIGQILPIYTSARKDVSSLV